MYSSAKLGPCRGLDLNEASLDRGDTSETSKRPGTRAPGGAGMSRGGRPWWRQDEAWRIDLGKYRLGQIATMRPSGAGFPAPCPLLPAPLHRLSCGPAPCLRAGGLPSIYDRLQPSGVWRSLVAHLVRDEGVAGSNPATPTTISHGGAWLGSAREAPAKRGKMRRLPRPGSHILRKKPWDVNAANRVALLPGRRSAMMPRGFTRRPTTLRDHVGGACFQS